MVYRFEFSYSDSATFYSIIADDVGKIERLYL